MKKIFSLVLIFLFTHMYSTEHFGVIEERIFKINSSLRDVGVYYDKPEVLKYKIYWEFIYAGDAEMKIEIKEINGKKFYYITTNTSSNKTVDLIYKVRNKTESIVDYKGFYSLKFIKDQNEAGYISKDYVLFDHINNKWIYLLDNTNGYIPAFVLDVVSSLYWLRLQNIEVGRNYTFNIWVGKVVYPMVVEVLSVEDVEVFGKKYRCFKVEPKVDLKSFPLFKAKGRLFVYITVDEKIPVRLESKVFIGRVFANLVEIK